jgi:hypothetical protein
LSSHPGLSDVPGEAMVKLYCPKCQDVYTPKSSRHHHTDGAYFGTGFPHMLFMVHPEYRPKRPANQFVPKYVILMNISIVKLRLVVSLGTIVRPFNKEWYKVLLPTYNGNWYLLISKSVA